MLLHLDPFLVLRPVYFKIEISLYCTVVGNVCKVMYFSGISCK